ncbi:glutathione S-transferase 1-1-like [Acyrthosiphon pisum]|uniref:Uncharacterized protein n=1 Tax=Acyrthosiphon pisum TaxID=7029 RepID=A0A8R2JR22_ACYPI|nr:glutathione S-transferase 1-1-like [Acyrthosiphon pisum]
MTVADFTLVASISTFKVAGVDLTKYDNINEWLIKCMNTMDGYEKANQEGIVAVEATLKYLDKKFANLSQTQSL